MNSHYDVIVIGAGPAGARTASLIAQKGFKVALLEEHDEVGIPIHCSGLISPRTLELAGLPEESIVLNRLKRSTFHWPDGHQLNVGNGQVRALAIDRSLLDKGLVEQALNAGAELLLGTKLTWLDHCSSAVRLQVTRDGAERQLTAHLVIGADGAHSTVARQCGHAQPEVVRAVTAEMNVDGCNPDTAHVFIDSSFAKGWFAWVIPLTEHKARLGLGTLDPNASLRSCFQRFLTAHGKIIGNLNVGRVSGGTIPVQSLGPIFGDNVMLVGDAAGQAKPHSGGGVFTSLVAAQVCAEVAINALHAGDLSSKMLAQYQDLWDQRMGRQLAWSHRVMHTVNRLGDSQLAKMAGVAKKLGIEAIASAHGDIDFPWRMVAPLVRAQSTIAPLIRMIGAWPPPGLVPGTGDGLSMGQTVGDKEGRD